MLWNGTPENIEIIEQFNCFKVCVTKWIKVNKLLNGQYSVSKNIRFKTPLLSRLRFERYFSHHPDDGRSISWNLAYLNILVHDVINLLYYEYWTDKQKYFYVYPLLRSDLFDCSDTYIVLKGTITVGGTNANSWTNKELAFKNNAPFR